MKRVTLFMFVALLFVPGVSRLVAQSGQDRWEPTIKKFEEGDRVSPPPQNAIVFIGAFAVTTSMGMLWPRPS